MGFNTICIRVSFALYFLIEGPALVFVYRHPVLRPLAVSFLPSATAQAQYTARGIYVEYHEGAQRQKSYIAIAYAGHAATVVTKSPLPVRSERAQEELALKLQSEKERLGLPAETKIEPPELPFLVRYVRAAPAYVVRDFPDASLLQYYGDTWTFRDFVILCIRISFFSFICVLFVRHLRKSRPSRRRGKSRSSRPGSNAVNSLTNETALKPRTRDRKE